MGFNSGFKGLIRNKCNFSSKITWAMRLKVISNKVLLIEYNTFRAKPEDGCIIGAETFCCYT